MHATSWPVLFARGHHTRQQSDLLDRSSRSLIHPIRAGQWMSGGVLSVSLPCPFNHERNCPHHIARTNCSLASTGIVSVYETTREKDEPGCCHHSPWPRRSRVRSRRARVLQSNGLVQRADTDRPRGVLRGAENGVDASQVAAEDEGFLGG